MMQVGEYLGPHAFRVTSFFFFFFAPDVQISGMSYPQYFFFLKKTNISLLQQSSVEKKSKQCPGKKN